MAANNVLDRIRKLDEEKDRLVAEAREQALAKAQEAIDELSSLGFSYRLAEGSTNMAMPPKQGSRRSGIRDEVVSALKNYGATGANRAELLDRLGVKGDRAGEQSVSNALSSLKKAGTLSQKSGRYIAT